MTAEAGHARDVTGPVTAGEAAVLLGVGAVGATATVSLALAQAGCHDGWASLTLGGLIVAGLAVVSARRGRLARLRLDRGEVALVLATLIAAGVMFLPGFPYAYGDKDPGVYVSHSFAIAREGSVVIDDELVAADLPVRSLAPGARFPGFWVEADHPDAVTPQFYHLYPALLASAIDVAGTPAAWNVNPLLAALSVLALGLAVRRAVGTVAAWMVVALQVTFMPQVWQARYPSTEILAQLLLNGMVLALVIALTRRSRVAAAAAGAFVGIGFLARPDGLLYVLLAIVALAALAVLGRFDRVAAAFGASLAVTLPYAIWNAFDARAGYTADNGLPGLRTITAGVVALGILVAVLVRLVPGVGRTAAGWLGRRRSQLIVGGVAVAVVAGVLVGSWYRQRLLGIDHTHFGSQLIRSYDELNLRWLAHFLFVPGIIAAWLGLAVVLLRPWRWELIVTVAPGLLVLPLYLWEARISPRLMWWVRRYIPGVVPSLLVLVAVLAGWLFAHASWARRAAGLAVAVGLSISFATQSLPLRDHREMGGSHASTQALSDLSPGVEAIYLFTYPDGGIYDPRRNLPGPLWFIHDELAAYLAEAPTPADLAAYQAAFPDRPIFVVTPPDGVPPSLAAADLDPVLELRAGVSAWEESTSDRPNQVMQIPVQLDVFRLMGT